MMFEPKITAAEVAKFLNLTVQAVHKRIKMLGLKEKKYSNKIYFGHDTARKLITPIVNPLKIAISVVKGGVGKTTLTEALAIRASLYGLRVLCVDVDQQANLTMGLLMGKAAKSCPVMVDLVDENASVEDAILHVLPGLDLLPSRLDNVTLDGNIMLKRINPDTIFRKVLAPIEKNYDLILFDCPPTIAATVCASILASDLVISPLNPDIYSYEGIEIMHKEIKNIEKQFNRAINWLILLNRFDSKTILSTDFIQDLFDNPKFKKNRLNSLIRTSQEFSNAKKKDKSIYDTLRATTAKEDIDELTKEIINLMKTTTKRSSAKVKMPVL